MTNCGRLRRRRKPRRRGEHDGPQKPRPLFVRLRPQNCPDFGHRGQTRSKSRKGERAMASAECTKRLEARVRIELTYKGFADLSLTTWVPRPETAIVRGLRTKNWSGRRDLNP